MFWSRLNEICKQKNTTPTAVVRACNLSSGNVTLWKNGAVPRGTTLSTLAAYFGVTVSELIGESPIVAPEPETEGTEQEKELIAQFRGTTPSGRLRMIQAVMNIYDEEEKKKPAANKNAAG